MKRKIVIILSEMLLLTACGGITIIVESPSVEETTIAETETEAESFIPVVLREKQYEVEDIGTFYFVGKTTKDDSITFDFDVFLDEDDESLASVMFVTLYEIITLEDVAKYKPTISVLMPDSRFIYYTNGFILGENNDESTALNELPDWLITTTEGLNMSQDESLEMSKMLVDLINDFIQ